MRAITCDTSGDPDVLTLAHVPTPEPDPGEVRMRVHAATMSSADVTFRRGKDLMARLFTGLRAPKRPVLGTELAGTIDAIGAGERALADRVEDDVEAGVVPSRTLAFTSAPSARSFSTAAAPLALIASMRGLLLVRPSQPSIPNDVARTSLKPRVMRSSFLVKT